MWVIVNNELNVRILQKAGCYSTKLATISFSVRALVHVSSDVFSVVTPCSVVTGYQRFSGPFPLYRQGGVVGMDL
jgi:hypothetical protein